MGFDLEVAQGRSIAIRPRKNTRNCPRRRSIWKHCSPVETEPTEQSGLRKRPNRKLRGRQSNCVERGQLDRGPARPLWNKRIAKRSRPTSFRKGRWSCNRPTNVGEAARTTPPVAHRADRPHDAQADSGSARPTTPHPTDSRPQNLRPRDGFRRVPGRSLPATW